jgi:uncharacterized ferritin-like protein (DUF455 family)
VELREWATRILSGESLDEKLFDPLILTDEKPGSPLLWKEPARPLGMSFKRHSRKERLPSFSDHSSQDKRAICLHRFAGHELLAVEIMAYALLAFPDAPKHFRKGLANTLREEQGHVKLYMKRMSEMGLEFGAMPLYKHFWGYIPYLTTPLRYISVMSLTLEMANLDFAPHYGDSFRQHGDEESAKLMERIFEDEISHVSFGLNWLRKMKSNEKAEWDVWCENLPPLVKPSRAKGLLFFEEGRRRAGASEEWISSLRDCR